MTDIAHSVLAALMFDACDTCSRVCRSWAHLLVHMALRHDMVCDCLPFAIVVTSVPEDIQIDPPVVVH